MKKPTQPRMKHVKPDNFAQNPGQRPTKHTFTVYANVPSIEEESSFTFATMLQHVLCVEGMQDWFDSCPRPEILQKATASTAYSYNAIELDLEDALSVFDEASYNIAVDVWEAAQCKWKEAQAKAKAHNKKATEVNTLWRRYEEWVRAKNQMLRLQKLIKELEG